MKALCCYLKPLTPFGSPLLGETLFGQLCWAIARLDGEARLGELLEGYGQGRPFMVVSDGFPKGFVPLPEIPPHMWTPEEENRKELKKRIWLPIATLSGNCPWKDWRRQAMNDKQVRQVVTHPEKANAPIKDDSPSWRSVELTMHNTINRATATTGTGMFAPYVASQTRSDPAVPLAVYAVIDEARFSVEDFVRILRYVGLSGFGRDSSSGLGKFEPIGEPKEQTWPQIRAKNFLTLASCALDGLEDVDGDRTFYRCKTHFGRHGDSLAHGGNPFKQPILLGASGSVVSFKSERETLFVGHGIVGVSKAQPAAVHQGYSPAVPLPDFFD